MGVQGSLHSQNVGLLTFYHHIPLESERIIGYMESLGIGQVKVIQTGSLPKNPFHISKNIFIYILAELVSDNSLLMDAKKESSINRTIESHTEAEEKTGSELLDSFDHLTDNLDNSERLDSKFESKSSEEENVQTITGRILDDEGTEDAEYSREDRNREVHKDSRNIEIGDKINFMPKYRTEDCQALTITRRTPKDTTENAQVEKISSSLSDLKIEPEQEKQDLVLPSETEKLETIKEFPKLPSYGRLRRWSLQVLSGPEGINFLTKYFPKDFSKNATSQRLSKIERYMEYVHFLIFLQTL